MDRGGGGGYVPDGRRGGDGMRVALTIAGSDSGGGAGIQADLKTFQAFGVFGTSAITAITAQNTLGVTAVHAVPPEMVAAQIRAVASDLAPAACKTGMLATRAVVETVAAALREHHLPNLVVDPVMIATSGDRLLDADAERALADALLPHARLVTPNLDEAALLAGFPVDDVASMERAARTLVERGARAALIKGGHLGGDTVTDLLYDGHEMKRWRRARLATRAGHGTGCTLSAAVAAGLALARPLIDAVEVALDYVHRALAAAPALGAGSAPLNHFVPVPGSRVPATSP
jgi:hydroxymethylpyrimidine/phosphomethylpyrimidine kinase